jgi:hypothetical protein
MVAFSRVALVDAQSINPVFYVLVSCLAASVLEKVEQILLYVKLLPINQ